MFAEALKTVSTYTHPVIISNRFYDGRVECGCAAFIVLNEEGWILTAAHILRPLRAALQHEKERLEHQRKKVEIEFNTKLGKKKKNKKLKALRVNKDWIVNQSYWWGKDDLAIKHFKFDDVADLATGKLEPFDRNWVSTYPKFKNANGEFPVGTPLCRLGFPFHAISATFEEKKKTFEIAKRVLPLPRFPLDGIHTRVAVVVDQASKRQVKFIETSSPGLRGQSGGPIFDVEANIWALQSSTSHLPLGFSPKVKCGDREVEEHQFMNVGLGTHVNEIAHFLADKKIEFQVSD